MNCKKALGTFATAFVARLSEAVTTTGTEDVEFLVQCAGVYEFGQLLEHAVERRGTTSVGLQIEESQAESKGGKCGPTEPSNIADQ